MTPRWILRPDAQRGTGSPTHRFSLCLDGETVCCTAMSEAAALAVVRQFELAHAGNREAYASVYSIDDIGLSQRLYSWWGGERFGPRDTRHPMERLMRKAVRSGARVTIMADGDCWRFNQDEPVRHRRAA